MKWKFLAAVVLAAGQFSSAQAVVINQGDVVRDAYSLTGSELQPASITLRFNGDLFDPGESFAVNIFDAGLNQLTSTVTSLNPNQVGGRAAIARGIDRDDFLPGILGPFEPLRIPNTGFIEVVSLAGSLDLRDLRLVASDTSSFPFVISDDVLDGFSSVDPPNAVPGPATLLLLLSAILGLASFGRPRIVREGLAT